MLPELVDQQTGVRLKLTSGLQTSGGCSPSFAQESPTEKVAFPPENSNLIY
jgi:hypothetical protein